MALALASTNYIQTWCIATWCIVITRFRVIFSFFCPATKEAKCLPEGAERERVWRLRTSIEKSMRLSENPSLFILDFSLKLVLLPRGPQDIVQESEIYDAQDYCGGDACFLGVSAIIPCI